MHTKLLTSEVTGGGFWLNQHLGEKINTREKIKNGDYTLSFYKTIA